MARPLGLLLAGTALLIATACADREDAGVTAVADAASGFVERLEAPGLAVAVLRDGELVWSEGFGRTGTGADSPAVTDRTVFEFASLSKTVFAAVAVGLAEQGVYDLDGNLGPAADFPRIADASAFAAVTPRLVLSHGTALPNWADEDGGPLAFSGAPGSRFSYSGEAYGLLQAMLERRTGSGLDELFAPLAAEAGMTESHYAAGAAGAAAEPVLAVNRDGSTRQRRDAAQPHAAASLTTSVHDYARFLVWLFDAQQAGLRAALFTPTQETAWDYYGAEGEMPEGVELDWGLGWGLYREDGRRIAFHWGDNGAFKSFVAIDLDRRDAIVFAANGFDGMCVTVPLTAPVVGDLGTVTDWLNYSRIDSGSPVCPDRE